MKSIIKTILISFLIIFVIGCEQPQEIQTLGQITLDTDNTTYKFKQKYDGIALSIGIESSTINVKETPIKVLWPGEFKVIINDSNGDIVWDHSYSEKEGYEVIRSSIWGVWELLPKRSRRLSRDPKIRPFMNLGKGKDFKIHIRVVNFPKTVEGINYKLYVAQIRFTWWEKLTGKMP